MSKLFYTFLSGFLESVGGQVPPTSSDFIPVIFELSQSNGGQAEAARLALTDQITAAGLTKMTYVKTPPNCRIWNDPLFTLNSTGTMQDVNAGVTGTQYYTNDVFGADVALTPLLRDATTAGKAYYIKAMWGGTALYQDGALRDWNANSVDDLLDIALNKMATNAIPAILAENPGKQIKVAILRHQGESDNTDIERNAYYQNSLDFLAKIRNFSIGGVQYFADAPFLDTLLYYRPLEAQEGLMNDLKLQFAAEQPNCYTVDIRNQPRKQDLTTAQKGGFAPSLSDNEHSSYLSQIQKAENAYDLLKSINWI